DLVPRVSVESRITGGAVEIDRAHSSALPAEPTMSFHGTANQIVELATGFGVIAAHLLASIGSQA
ncbi:MAG TPA: hypothetical protein VKQ27_13235, partial [Acetobacteraceae bacterium]|nr:hypothetical protein [Acetobacteraceae bacterium]